MRPNSLRRSSIAIAFAFVFTSLACRAIAAVEYTAFDLTPYGRYESLANGISGNIIAGGAGPFEGFVWNVDTRKAKSLHYYGTVISDISGNQVVGNNFRSAILGDISSDTSINLNPSGYDRSGASGTNGTQQVGYGVPSGFTIFEKHALLWNGSAESVVDLNPEGYFSTAFGISGTQQVGYKYKRNDGSLQDNQLIFYEDAHAVLWNGTAESAIDLNPQNFETSKAIDICGNQQVGYGTLSTGGESVFDPTKTFTHALLWSGTAESAVDLNPADFVYSQASDTNGSWQVGYGYGEGTGGEKHASLWNGTPESAVDLHDFLSTEFVSSTATGIDERGNIVGNAFDAWGYSHAFLWSPVPEPSTIVLFGFAAIGLFAWFRRRVG
jgi:hypothetical protein